MHIATRNAALAATGGRPAAARPLGARAGCGARVGAVAALAFAHAAACAQAAAAAHPVEGPSFAPMALALLLVLALIGAALWVLRRTGIAPRGAGGPLRLVSQLALGPRERVVVVEIGDRWWLLGVGAAGVTRLGSVPRGETGATAAPAASFGALFEKLRGGGK